MDIIMARRIVDFVLGRITVMNPSDHIKCHIANELAR